MHVSIYSIRYISDQLDHRLYINLYIFEVCGFLPLKFLVAAT